MQTSIKKTILVTGGAGGLGSVLIGRLIDEGYSVIALDKDEKRLKELYNGKNPQIIPADISNSEQISGLSGRIEGICPRLDGIVHMAGTLAVGSMIELDDEEMRRVLEANLLGPFRINKALFPLLRRTQGRIIMISSETGVQTGAPFNGAYALSKHALECYTDSLRRELQLFGVSVVTVRPGSFRSAMSLSVKERFENIGRDTVLFSNYIPRFLEFVSKEEKKAKDPGLLAELIVKLLRKKRPKPHYAIKNDMGRKFLDILPTRLGDVLYKTVMK